MSTSSPATHDAAADTPAAAAAVDASANEAGRGRPSPGSVSLQATGIEVTYRVFTDGQRPKLRQLVSRGFKPRPHRDVHAVRGVDLTAHVGEAVALIGRNGSGKSTLLRAVAGLQPVNAGRVLARSAPVLLGVGAALHPELSGRRNVFLGGTALGMSRAEIAERFDEIVDFAGVRESIDLPLRTYSSGMAARLRFAVSSAITPDILMVDEALSVGDEQFRKRSEKRIKRLLSDAGTVVIVSHNLQTVREMCTRAVWMHDGRIRADGEVNEIVDEYVAESNRDA